MAVYAFSDVHGNYNLWTAIKNYCKKDDILFFLGDAIDRGPDGIKIMQELINDKRVIYLLGNHEDTLLDYIDIGIPKVLKDEKELFLIEYNECLDTLKSYLHLTDFDKAEIVDYLKNKTFIKYIYNNKDNKKIVLCHAGCDANHINGEYPAKDYIWDRKHIKTKAENWDIDYNDYIVIHGHTPVQLMQDNKYNPFQKVVVSYCGNHKIDIDMGSFVSNKIALINLDTLEVLYFEDRSIKNEQNK